MKNHPIMTGLAHFTCFIGILFLYILPKNKYEWMLQMDSSLKELPKDEGESVRAIAALLILFYVVAVEVFIFVGAQGNKKRALPVILMLTAIAVWLFKWL
jgi:hypothetical protein